MSFTKSFPQGLSSLEAGRPFVKCLNGNPCTSIYNYIYTVDGLSEIELFDGTVLFMDSNTLVYAL